MNCARHPSVETNLTCSRCGTPICPKCLIYAPVGVRCPSCAQVKKLPTFQVSYKDILKGLAAGLAVGIALGFLLGFMSDMLFRIPFLPWIALVGVGYLVGESISLATNRKRGVPLMIIAAASVLMSFIIISMVGKVLLDPLVEGWNPHASVQDVLWGIVVGLVALAASIYFAVTRVR